MSAAPGHGLIVRSVSPTAAASMSGTSSFTFTPPFAAEPAPPPRAVCGLGGWGLSSDGIRTCVPSVLDGCALVLD